MPFQRTTAINKLLALKKRKKVVQGGAWAGKTCGILAVLINYAASNPKKKITIVAETFPAVRAGAMEQFKQTMQETGRWINGSFNITHSEYTFSNKTVVEFRAFADPETAAVAGKRDVLFINEANHISFAIADQLIFRTDGDIWLDFNPTSEFWAHTEVLTDKEGAELLLLKYTDNEGLPDNTRQELVRRIAMAKVEQDAGLPDTSHWQNWKRVYIDGEIGNIMGLIFNNWEIVNEVTKDAKRVGYGMDFGFTNDPTAVVDTLRQDGYLYVDEILYKTGLTNPAIVAALNEAKIDKYKDLIADSAEPKSIQEIYEGGYRNIYGAKKGPDSVRASINKLQAEKLRVTARSVNVIKELRSYKWKVDKNNKPTGEPVGVDDHAIAALRYVALNLIGDSGYSYA